MPRIVNQLQSAEARLKRLAQGIETAAVQDRQLEEYARQMGRIRRMAALEVYQACSELAASVNRHLSSTELLISPSEYSGDSFREDGANLIQLSVQGRILQVDFEATGGLTCTEDFRIPYTLQGSVRAFNQALLDRNLIEEHLIYYTVEKRGNMWRFFDARTYRSGALNQDYLVSMLERLI